MGLLETYYEARKVLLREVENIYLTEIPEGFYKKPENIVNIINRKIISLNPNSDDVKMLERTLTEIKRIYKEISTLRNAKTLIASREGITRQVSHEKKLLHKTNKSLKQATQLRRENEKREPLIKTLILFNKETPKFMGVDGRVYGPFKPGDIAYIPNGNATPLKNKGYVEEVSEA